jgi:hypothetical protein
VIYACGEVREPINADGSSVFRAGRVVPVKFAVTDWGRTLVDSATAHLAFVKEPHDEFIEEKVVEATTIVAATTRNLFRYNAREQQYIYNWSTRGMDAGTHQLFIALDDGKRYTPS